MQRNPKVTAALMNSLQDAKFAELWKRLSAEEKNAMLAKVEKQYSNS